MTLVSQSPGEGVDALTLGQAASRSEARTANEVDKFVGSRIRARRLEIGISQERLADMVGVTFQQVQKYEKGVNRVSASTLYRVCQALDISVTALMPSLQTRPTAASESAFAELSDLVTKLSPEGQTLLLELARTLASSKELSRRR